MSQLLFFPMEKGYLSTGFKNADYAKANGFPHFGIDMDEWAANGFDVLAGGSGVVLGTEKNANSIGGVVVIRYEDVYNPTTKKVQDLIARYLHLSEIKVKKGERVTSYQPIGHVLGDHPWWNHIHLELDTDTAYPFNTPQVSEGASRLLIRNPATDSTMINPIEVLVVGDNQTAEIHPKAIYTTAADKPRWNEGDLTLPTSGKKICPTCGREMP